MNHTTKKPRVSIVIPTYNRGDLIGDTIRSIQDQNFTDYEVIIVDDGSADNTHQICEDCASKDVRFTYVGGDTKNRGPGYCRNIGARMSHGEFLIFLDSDDLLFPHTLADRVELMEQHPDLDFMVFLGEFFMREPGDRGLLWNIPTSTDPLVRFVGDDTPWQTTGPIWKRDAYERTGLWDENIVGCDDQDFHARALMAGLRYKFIGKIDYAIRGAVDQRDQLGMVLSKKIGIMSQVARIKNLCETDFNFELEKLRTVQKMMAGSLLLRCYQMLEFHSDKEAAEEIWKIVRKYRLISFFTYCLGCLWVSKYRSFVGDIAAYVLNCLGSDDFLLKNRAVLGTIPTSCLQEDPYDGRFHRQPSFVSSAAVRKGLMRYLMAKLRLRAA